MGACCDSKPFGKPCADCAFDTGTVEFPATDADKEIGPGSFGDLEFSGSDPDASRLVWAATVAGNGSGGGAYWATASLAAEFFRGRSQEYARPSTAIAALVGRVAEDNQLLSAIGSYTSATLVDEAPSGARARGPATGAAAGAGTLIGGAVTPGGAPAPGLPSPDPPKKPKLAGCCCVIDRVGWRFHKRKPRKPERSAASKLIYAADINVTVNYHWIESDGFEPCTMKWEERASSEVKVGDDHETFHTKIPAPTGDAEYGAWKDISPYVAWNGGVPPKPPASSGIGTSGWTMTMERHTKASCPRLVDKHFEYKDHDYMHTQTTPWKAQVKIEFGSGCGPTAVLPVFTFNAVPPLTIDPEGPGHVPHGAGPRWKRRTVWNERAEQEARKKKKRAGRRRR